MPKKQLTNITREVNSFDIIHVTFPSWSISDGSYNSFRKGQKVNFALNIENAKFRKSIKKQCYLKHRRFSEYSFCAKIIGNYSQKGMDGHFLVLETGVFKFFMHSYSHIKNSYQEGEFIVGKGNIEVDYFIWDEQSYKIHNVPDIYCDFEIKKILYIKFPIEYTDINNKVIISNTSLSSNESEFEIVEIENMTNMDEMEKEINEKMDDYNILVINNPSFVLFVLNRNLK